MTLSLVTEEADTGMRLDRFLRARFPGLNQGMIEKWARKGALRVNGGRAKPSDRLEPWQAITLPEEAAGFAAGEKKQRPASAAEVAEIRSWVIHEDRDLFVLNKPAGIAVQGGSGQKRSIDRMAALLQPEDPPRLVHRLDRDTSGILLLARSRAAAGKLAGAFAGKDVEKYYRALVAGVPRPQEGLIDLPLAKGVDEEEPDKNERVRVDSDAGKRAVTRYSVMDALANRLALVELMPVTGRTHQLRAHMAAIGHPILGDRKYGDETAFPGGIGTPHGLCLHAHAIRLPDGRHFEAPFPPAFKALMRELGLDC